MMLVLFESFARQSGMIGELTSKARGPDLNGTMRYPIPGTGSPGAKSLHH